MHSQRRGTVSAAISEMYPITIPAPSQVGKNTLANFYQQNKKNLFKTDKNFKLAMDKADKESAIMKFLRLKSEMRNPPLNWNESIMPPRNFVKYPSSSNAAMFNAVAGDGVDYPHIDSNHMNYPTQTTVTKINLDLQEPRQASQSNSQSINNRVRPSKLIFRKSHPNFNQVILEQQIKGIYRLATTNKDIV